MNECSYSEKTATKERDGASRVHRSEIAEWVHTTTLVSTNTLITLYLRAFVGYKIVFSLS